MKISQINPTFVNIAKNKTKYNNVLKYLTNFLVVFFVRRISFQLQKVSAKISPQ